jgi:hypothetical protein
LTDVFLTGTNAITEDGKLFNIDATGNRVGAMFIGPKKVLVISGVNKIVKDIQAAEERLRGWAAPQNAKRLNKKTPCTETGVCGDCSSPDRICNIYVSMAKRPTRTEIVVVLIGNPRIYFYQFRNATEKAPTFELRARCTSRWNHFSPVFLGDGI